MADFFFDTSALVKRFSRETGTAWVIDLVRPGGSIEIIVGGNQRESVNRELEMLRTIFSFAEQSDWVAKSPFKKGAPLISKASERQRDRVSMKRPVCSPPVPVAERI